MRASGWRRSERLALCAAAACAFCLPPAAARAAGPEGGLDARGWEMVSPVWKNGGEVGAPGSAAAGVLQAAAGGGGIAFGSAASFGEAEGAAPVNQYLATREAFGWSTRNITPPLLSGTYAGGAYQLFSGDLARGLLGNGWSCRNGEASCAAANPPLAPGAPDGYRNLYLREGSSFQALITTVDAPALALPPQSFFLSLAGASADLRHVVVSTCAALSAEATEVPGAEGCDPGAQNLYEWSGGGLRLLNLLPAQSEGTPGARLAAPSGGVSADGARVYFTDQGDLYVREGTTSESLDGAVSGGGEFQTATPDGAFAFFTKAGHLYRYDAATHAAVDLVPSGGVVGVLGASEDGSVVYFETSSGLFRYHEGVTTPVAAEGQPSDWPPATGTARVSADGEELLFLSKAQLTGYDNRDRSTGEPDSQVYLFDAAANGGAGLLRCLSCNPDGERPLGPSTIPGAAGAGEGPRGYKPRALSDSGSRVFFDSGDSLLLADTDGRPDVYEWEQAGTGSCARAGGCLGLISDGRGEGASFVDASASGEDAYFTTVSSLLPADPGALDLYDARAGGGFPEPAPTIPCEGDECQGPPPPATGPTPGTATLNGPANQPLRWPSHRKRHPHRHRGKKRHHHHRHRPGGRR